MKNALPSVRRRILGTVHDRAGMVRKNRCCIATVRADDVPARAQIVNSLFQIRVLMPLAVGTQLAAESALMSPGRRRIRADKVESSVSVSGADRGDRERTGRQAQAILALAGQRNHGTVGRPPAVDHRLRVGRGRSGVGATRRARSSRHLFLVALASVSREQGRPTTPTRPSSPDRSPAWRRARARHLRRRSAVA